ncbi:cytochrome b561 domain-containing protein 2 [Drosophila serrata]|uniref:cytochrome b561 domain-containing protein 2 n=1 Tax=Drosophila serrata TaxID=7274 RepID=UPI000A1CF7BE|nr:cytochrome b561 domain-containing protein 2 [Drosophila serrata]XP_020810300.1 cytochrome b561 domain-containing protein 2 [Drosophila serrata]
MPEAYTTATAWLQIQSLLNSINHILIFLVAAFFFVLARSLDFKDTAMHMFMTGIGFHVLIAQAMMSHNKVNPVTRWLSHRNKSRFHAILQIVGGSMVLLGGIGKFSNKDVHFNTWHGRVGAAATFGCAASIVGGFVNYFQPKFALKFFPPSELRFRHNLFGLLTFSLGMGAIYLGYYSKFFTKFVDNDFIPAMMLVTALVYVLTIISPVLSLLTKLRYRSKKKTEKQVQ